MSIKHLMNLLSYGGFFRENGLNSLPSIKRIAKLMKMSDVFKNVNPKIESIKTFLDKSKNSIVSLNYLKFTVLDSAYFCHEIHSPIIGLDLEFLNEKDPKKAHGRHAVVLREVHELKGSLSL